MLYMQPLLAQQGRELAVGVPALIPIWVPPDHLEGSGGGGEQKRVAQIGDSHDGYATRCQDPGSLRQGRARVEQVLDGAHGIEEVKGTISKGKLGDVGD